MGKVIERVKITNVFEPGKSIEIDALIDTGATMVVLPQDIVHELELRKVREIKVRYANNKVEMNPMCVRLSNLYPLDSAFFNIWITSLTKINTVQFGS